MKRVIVPSHRVPAAGVGAHALVLSPDGRYALTTQLDWSVEPMRTALRHCDLQSGESTVTSRAELQLRLFADARHVLMGDAQSAGTVIVDVLDGSTVATRWPTSDGAISPDGTLFVTATGADDGELRCIERDGTVRWRQKSRDYARFVLCAWATASRIVVGLRARWRRQADRDRCCDGRRPAAPRRTQPARGSRRAPAGPFRPG
jgi:hypothetical protein